MANADDDKESKKDFLHPDIFIKCLMIIQVIMRDIAENAACILQTRYPVLVNGM